mmetsp:Transcript_34715/g.52376  ORF Transcript_34715/g.52376 Transcript_34715/m.52376 type:complete len:126 (-) Transcript_34715:376-753(-)
MVGMTLLDISDPKLKEIGLSCGIDIEAILGRTYSNEFVESSFVKDNLTSVKRVGGVNVETHSSSPQGSGDISALDNYLICKECHGQGLRKVYYNYQVKDFNCEECSGEGILRKKSSKLTDASNSQ